MCKQPLIILTGPTAVGKTSLSIKLAKKIGAHYFVLLKAIPIIAPMIRHMV